MIRTGRSVKVLATGGHQDDEPGGPGGYTAAYLIGGQRFEAGTPRFAEAVAAAHAARQRPRCLCLAQGVEMYVARLAGAHEGYVVKRMPGTGSQHAPHCPCYEPPPEATGLGQVLGSAISEDPATGETTLKLDFPLSKIAGRSTAPPASGESDSVATDGTRLSLRGLLHYLWDQAELTRWHPGFAGKRSWAKVRRHLLQAAEHKIAGRSALQTRLYIPEVFSVEQRDAINARRLAQWAKAVAQPGHPQHLMLMIAEVKEIMPARYGHKAVVKHVPDQAFTLDEQLYRRMGRRFESELSMWGATDKLHMVMIATFAVSEAGVPAIMELSLMPVTNQWLPVEDTFEQRLVDRLVREGRAFTKGLRYNLDPAHLLICATLTDTDERACAMLIVRPTGIEDSTEPAFMPIAETALRSAWIWRTAEVDMPSLPLRRQHLAD